MFRAKWYVHLRCNVIDVVFAHIFAHSVHGCGATQLSDVTARETLTEQRQLLHVDVIAQL